MLRARLWVCAVCVVSVRCVPWCVVLPLVCASGAPLSGALLRCCARRVLSVRDADSQQIQFEFAEFAGNSFAARICCEFGLKFLVLRNQGEFALRIRR